ncbi:MAG: DUF4159 domain-containing protein [Gemmatimonadota bacterium]|nr:DUF4159 domain-containing protein [Gemmatimonadota bacterium]
MRLSSLVPLLALITLGGEGQEVPNPTAQRSVNAEVLPQGRAFYFTRAVYTSYGRWGRGSWSVDFPKADRQFLIGLQHLTGIDAYELENPISLDDPALRRFPFVYAVEVGRMALTDAEAEGLRSYLLAGGFMIVDDFWGSREWENFEWEMRRVLPEYPIVELPSDHPLLDTFYRIDEILQVPNHRQGRWGGPTWERDGYEPHLRAIFDDADRLMVLISWNSDLGDAWEWAEDPFYPLPFSNYAYRLGVNVVLYGMSR